jgi:ribonuclease HI
MTIMKNDRANDIMKQAWGQRTAQSETQSETQTEKQYVGNYTLFADGACEPNPGIGGWAFILRNNETEEESVGSGGDKNSTNNRMEMMGVIAGLETLETPANVTVVSDSKYVIDGMRSWRIKWKKNGWHRKGGVKNLELWLELDKLADKHNLSYEWVKGHSGHPENERCDSLAMNRVRQGHEVHKGQAMK